MDHEIIRPGAWLVLCATCSHELQRTIFLDLTGKYFKNLCRPWPHKYMIDSLGLSKIMCELKTAQYSFLPYVKKDFSYV